MGIASQSGNTYVEARSGNHTIPTCGLFGRGTYTYQDYSVVSFYYRQTIKMDANGGSTLSFSITGAAAKLFDDWWAQNYGMDRGWVATGADGQTVSISSLKPSFYVSTSPTYNSSASKTSCTVSGSKITGSLSMLLSANTTYYLFVTIAATGDPNGAVEGTFSASVTGDDKAPTISFSASEITTSGFKISASANVSCHTWQYKIDNGSWTTFASAAATSSSVTISGLSPNTSYNVQIRATKGTNGVVGASSSTTVKTLGMTALNSASDAYIDIVSPTLTFNVTVYSSFYHRLYLYSTADEHILHIDLGLYSAATNVSKTATLSAANRTTLLGLIPNAKTTAVKLYICTYSDSSYQNAIGWSSAVQITLKTSEGISAPVFPGFTWQDTNASVVAVTEDDQVLIQKYSHLVVTATAGTAKNGASITGYSVSFGDISLTSTTTTLDVGAIESTGEITAKVTCSDSRGYSTSVEATIKVIPYARPKISRYQIRRRNEIDALVQLTLSGSISSIAVDGTEKNAVSYVMYQYKSTSDDDSAYVTTDITSGLTINGLNFSYQNMEEVELDDSTTFDFRILVYDRLGELSVFVVEDVLPQGTPLLSFRKRTSTNNRPRVGLNNPTPYYELDVHGDIAMHDVLVQGYIADLTTEYLNNLRKGGYYVQADSDNVLTNKNYPIAEKPGFLEVLASPSGIVIQRYTPFDLSAVYIRYYDSSRWSNWGTI